MLTYKQAGCYRFLDELENVIYVGSSKNIDRRLKSHFGGKQGHLGSSVYSQVARVQVCKCNDYPTALALEQYLINKYKPRFNKKDKSHNLGSKVVQNEKLYNDLENWHMYYKFKELNKEKIKTTKIQDRLLLAFAYALFIFAIISYVI